MAEYNVTVAASFIPVIWSKDAIRAREANLVMFPRIANRTGEYKVGDTIRVPLVSNLTASDLNADGTYDTEAITESYSDVVINKRKVSGINITEETETKADRDLSKLYAEKIGYALAKIVDADILALYSNFTAVTAQDDIDKTMLLTALKNLDNSNVPEDERYCILCPTQYSVLFGAAEFTSANILGLNKSPFMTGKLPDYMGVEFLKSTQVPTSTTRKNLVWHRSAMAAAMAKKVEMRKKEVSKSLSWDYVGFEFYGVVCERTDHGYILPTVNT